MGRKRGRDREKERERWGEREGEMGRKCASYRIGMQR